MEKEPKNTPTRSVKETLQQAAAQTGLSFRVSHLPAADQDAQQREIHQRLVAKRLITPARKTLRLVSPPLELEGKPLSQCLAEVRE
jgi:hypothetical protein